MLMGSSDVDNETTKINALTLRYFDDEELERKYKIKKAASAVRPARNLGAMCSVILVIFVVVRFGDVGMDTTSMAILVAATAAGLMSLGMVVSSAMKRMSEYVVAGVTALGFFSLLVTEEFLNGPHAAAVKLRRANEALANGTCVEDWDIMLDFKYCFASFKENISSINASWVGFGLIAGFALEMRFHVISFAVALPIIMHGAINLVVASEHDLSLNGFLLTQFLPDIIVFFVVPYRMEWKDRLAFARGQRINTLMRKKDEHIQSQNAKLLRVETEKLRLEKQFLPSTEEEKMFAPFRETLREILGENLLNASEFETIRPLGKGAFGEVTLANWKRRGFEDLEVAVKQLHPHLISTVDEIEHLVFEIEMLDALHHPNVVKFFGVSQVLLCRACSIPLRALLASLS